MPPVATVSDAMVTEPKVLGCDSTVADLRRHFSDDHVHAVPLVDGRVLRAVVERGDLDGCRADAPAVGVGRLIGRTTDPTRPLAAVHQSMRDTGRRRLAVTDEQGALLGLLCLKRSGTGFCSDADVRARRG